jgi:thiol:disulfide interchange protein
VINMKENQALAHEALDYASAVRQNQTDIYQSQLSLARTAKDRRDLELKILDLQYQEEKARLEAITQINGSTKEQEQAAQDRLKILNQIHTNGVAAVNQRNQSPLQAYIDSIPKTGEELNEAFEKVAADGLDSLNDGLTQAIMGTKSLGEVFKNVANQIIASIVKIAIQGERHKAVGLAARRWWKWRRVLRETARRRGEPVRRRRWPRRPIDRFGEHVLWRLP